MRIAGVLPVLQTPYREDFSIDFDTLGREIDWVFGKGADGVVLALVSEIVRLTDAERDQLVRETVRFVAGRGPVIASVGAESIVQAVRHAQAAEEAGASVVMAIPPTLTRCDDEGILSYYRGILKITTLPLVVQDASGYLGNPIPIAVQAALHAQNPERVMFKPEAQPLGPNISRLRAATGGRAAIFEGTGGLALVEGFARGISGTMPGADLTGAIVPIWRALLEKDEKRARAIHLPLAALVSMLTTLDAFLFAEKLLLVRQGVFKNRICRGPVNKGLDAEAEAEILRLFDLVEERCA